MDFVKSHGWQTPFFDVSIADMSQPGYSKAIQEMKDEKAICMAYCQTFFRPSDVPKIKSELKKYFDYQDEDLAVLDTFDKSKIDTIIAKRKGKDPAYVPYDEESNGEALAITTSVGLFGKDRLNIWNPVTVEGVMPGVDRSEKPLNTLTFSHPLEDTPDKFFAVFTQSRAIVDEPHVKDLVDLYLRTKAPEKESRGWAPIRHENHASIIDMIRVQWPAHRAFAGSELYFKRTDPALSKSVSQVTKGLLKLKEHGIITSQTFGEPITEENAGKYAELLLHNAWDLAKEALGVEREGTQNNPRYNLKPPAAVADYWDTCYAIRAKVQHKPPREQDLARSSQIIDEVGTKIDTMLKGDYLPQDKKNIRNAASINAYLNADKTHFWAGLRVK
jgi:hypothetical protein